MPPTDPTIGDFAGALADERAGSARRINAFRAIAVTIFLVTLLGFRLRHPGWVGLSLWLFAGYCGAAVAVWAATRARPHVPWIASLSVSLIDMPMLLVLFWQTIDRLRAAGYAADASRFAFHAPLYYVLLLLLASLALESRQLYLAAGTKRTSASPCIAA